MQNLYFEEIVGNTAISPVQKSDVEHRLDRYFDDITGEYADYFKNIYKPGNARLVNGYKNVVYACSNLNAEGVADTSLKLYVTTDVTQKPTRLKTSAVNSQTQQKLRRQYKLRDDVLIQEVIEHPALKLIQDVNASVPFLDEFLLIQLTQLYLEICGQAYWWPVSGPFGIPSELYILPAQCVEPERDVGSTKYVDRYKYQWENVEKTFQPGELIQFLSPGLTMPYTEGISPEEASIESSILMNKLKSMMTGMFSKEARPDAIVSPKTEQSAWGADETKVWERKFNMKYGSGKSGGVQFFEEPIDFQILNFPPRDWARLDIQGNEKEEVANAFAVPVLLLKGENTTKMALEAAMIQHGRYSLRPRCKRFAGVLNKQFLSRYDNTGRLFFEFDDPVPEDKEAKMQEQIQKKMNGIWTANEVRDQDGMPPHSSGDELEAINTPGSGEQQRDNSRANGTAEK